MKKINELMLTHKVKITFSLMLLSILSFAVKSSLNAQVVISGPTLVCTTAQYSINCGGTITWTVGSNLTITSGQGTSTVTVSANGNGTVQISATYDCGGLATKYKDAWVGPPIISHVNNEGNYWDDHIHDWSFWPAYYDLSAPVYSLQVDSPGQVLVCCSGSWGNTYLPGDPYDYQLYLTSTNTCGSDNLQWWFCAECR